MTVLRSAAMTWELFPHRTGEAILIKGVIPDPMRVVLDLQLDTHERAQMPRVGPLWCQARVPATAPSRTSPGLLMLTWHSGRHTCARPG